MDRIVCRDFENNGLLCPKVYKQLWGKSPHLSKNACIRPLEDSAPSSEKTVFTSHSFTSVGITQIVFQIESRNCIVFF